MLTIDFIWCLPIFLDIFRQNTLTFPQRIISSFYILLFVYSFFMIILINFHLKEIISRIRKLYFCVCCILFDKSYLGFFNMLKIAYTVFNVRIALNKSAVISYFIRSCWSSAIDINCKYSRSTAWQESLWCLGFGKSIGIERKILEYYLTVITGFNDIISVYIRNITFVCVLFNFYGSSVVISQCKLCTRYYNITVKIACMVAVRIIMSFIDLDNRCTACNLGIRNCHWRSRGFSCGNYSVIRRICRIVALKRIFHYFINILIICRIVNGKFVKLCWHGIAVCYIFCSEINVCATLILLLQSQGNRRITILIQAVIIHQSIICPLFCYSNLCHRQIIENIELHIACCRICFKRTASLITVTVGITLKQITCICIGIVISIR